MLVLVTRAAAEAARTAAALARLGHAAIVAPVTTIRPTGAAMPATRCDALLATSRHAFIGLDAALDRRLPLFAVGRATAEAARAAGFGDVRIGTGDAEGLADLLRLTLPPARRLLYLAGRDRKPALERRLGAAGHRIETVVAYAAEPVACWPEAARDALKAGGIDAALHYSRRSVDITLDLARRDGLDDALLMLRHACLSADVAEPLLAAGAPRVAVPGEPDEDRLLALLGR